MPENHGLNGSPTLKLPPNETLKTTPPRCRTCIFRSYCFTHAHTCTTLKPSTLAMRKSTELNNSRSPAVDGKLLVPDEAAPALPRPPGAA